MEKKDTDNSHIPWNLCNRPTENDSQKFHLHSGFQGTGSQSLPSSPGSTSSRSFTSWNASRPKSYIMHKSFSSRSPLDQDLAPRFSGMNFGDVMKITVMKEMETLKMTSQNPLDLSKKSSGGRDS